MQYESFKLQISSSDGKNPVRLFDLKKGQMYPFSRVMF